MLNLRTIFKLLTGEYFRFYGGDSGGGGPTTTKVENTNVPSYAEPYVKNMLGATQKQLFNTDDATGNITGFREYQPYSTDMNKYVAGFSPMQEQAFSGIANMKTSPENAQAAGMAGMAGLNSLYAGQNYQNQATDASQIAKLMSPYQQNVTDYQKQQAISDYGRQLPGMNAQAVGQGAFGGSRQAVAGAEAQRSLQNQLMGIQASGTQDAFRNAQQAQQFGANLGLQGYGQANTAANTLLGAGQQDYGQRMGINAAQSAAGATQQTQEQNKINQQIQNYATQQQYPMMQLGMMSNMLRGLPMQAATTQTYQAAPSGMTQGIAGLGALGTAYKAFGSAEGGQIKGLAGGGEVAGYSVGGEIRQQIDSMSLPQLQQVQKTTQSEEIRNYVAQRIAMLEQTQKAQGPQGEQGLPAMESGSALESGLAGGGIIAFANEGIVPNPNILDANDARALVPPPVAGLAPPPPPAAPGSLQATVAEIQDQRRRMGISDAPEEERLAQLKTREAGLGDTEERAKYAKAFEFFANMGTQTGSPLSAALKSAKETAPGYEKLLQDQAAVREGIADKRANINHLARLEKQGLIKDAETQIAAEKKAKAELEKTKMEIDARVKAAGLLAQGSMAETKMRVDATGVAARTEAEILDAFAAKIAKDTNRPINDPGVRSEAYAEKERAKSGTGDRIDATRAAALLRTITPLIKTLETKLFLADPVDKPAIQAQIDEANALIFNAHTAAAKPTAAPSLQEQAKAEIAKREAEIAKRNAEK